MPSVVTIKAEPWAPPRRTDVVVVEVSPNRQLKRGIANDGGTEFEVTGVPETVPEFGAGVSIVCRGASRAAKTVA